MVERPAVLDHGLALDLCSLVKPEDAFQVVTGKTMCTLDFYEGEWRQRLSGKNQFRMLVGSIG